MSFVLPEEDRRYFSVKSIRHELVAENISTGEERLGVVFHGFPVPANLKSDADGVLRSCVSCDVLVLVPRGYATTKLDSFYVSPRLKRADGSFPRAADRENSLFGRPWQFWSRHLSDEDWRVGVDGFDTFLTYISNELRIA